MTESTKTLVTGGAGFIGSHVVRGLLAQGRAVRVLALPGENTHNLDGLDVEIVEGDVTDPARTDAVVKGCSRVFHLAAIYADWLPRPEKMYEVNSIGSLNLLWSCLRHGVERVVYTSSVIALGTTESGVADERTPFRGWSTNMEYARSKWLSEQEAMTFCRNGLDIRFCLPGVPFGVGDIAPTPTGQILLTVAKAMPRVVPDNRISVVAVEDVARGHLLAEQKGANGERYILTGQNTCLSEFVGTIGSLVGRPGRPVGVPPQLVAKLAPLGDHLEQRSYVSKKRPVVTGGALRYAALNFHFDNRKAREQLGMEFTPLRTALAQSLDWYIREGYIRDRAFIEGFERHGQKELPPNVSRAPYPANAPERSRTRQPRG